jgi:hypothetical protein
MSHDPDGAMQPRDAASGTNDATDAASAERRQPFRSSRRHCGSLGWIHERDPRSPWFVIAALAGHGLFDLAHPHIITNPGVPAFWRDFCWTYDVTAAIYLAAATVMQRLESTPTLRRAQ